MSLLFLPHIPKNEVFKEVRKYLDSKSYTAINEETRPWGGFFVIKEDLAGKFLAEYFHTLDKEEIPTENKLSPKILIVESGKRLSWQYHHRRAEFWKVIGGKAGVVKSDTDEENKVAQYSTGDIIRLKKGERHRLVGLDTWGIVAEIWQHTDKDNPSNEGDIVRLSDDFGR